MSHIHNRLSADPTWALLCLGAWTKSGFVEMLDLKHTASLPNAKDNDPWPEDEFILVQNILHLHLYQPQKNCTLTHGLQTRHRPVPVGKETHTHAHGFRCSWVQVQVHISQPMGYPCLTSVFGDINKQALLLMQPPSTSTSYTNLHSLALLLHPLMPSSLLFMLHSIGLSLLIKLLPTYIS